MGVRIHFCVSPFLSFRGKSRNLLLFRIIVSSLVLFCVWILSIPGIISERMGRYAKYSELRTTCALFRRALLGWFRRHGRDLPWRHTRDPYAILVSEFMLQQTQVATVIPYYNKWLHRFPDFAALAQASENDVLHAWQGLGYYARARNLHGTATIVQNRHRGVFPRDIAATRELPGIGRYISHAVATFAFNRSVPIVEANTARVLTRLFDIRAPIDSNAGRQALWQKASALVPKNSACAHNSALIDLGALVCLPRRPKCGICPVNKFCRARNPEALPIKKSRPRIRQLTENHSFIRQRGKILLEESSTRWRGLWILPPLTRRSTAARPIHISVFPFTHHRVTLAVYRGRAREKPRPNQRWFGSIDDVAMPSPHRRAAQTIMNRSQTALGVER